MSLIGRRPVIQNSGAAAISATAHAATPRARGRIASNEVNSDAAATSASAPPTADQTASASASARTASSVEEAAWIAASDRRPSAM